MQLAHHLKYIADKKEGMTKSEFCRRKRNKDEIESIDMLKLLSIWLDAALEGNAS